jgi:hypothetical protein
MSDKLVAGEYELQQGEPYWMPEVGLGIGLCQVMSDNLLQEQLAWFDEEGDRYLTLEERAAAEQQRAELEQQRAEVERQRRERLEDFLRSQGFDPDRLPE